MSQFFTDELKIRAWLIEHQITAFSINADLSVNVHANVDLAAKEIGSFPIQFWIVDGHFACSHNQLKSLKGCPRRVEGYLDISNNPLTSLDHLPLSVKWSIHAYDIPVIGILHLVNVDDLGNLHGLPDEVCDIILTNTEDKNLFACQQQLIEAGFEGYAQL